MFKHIFILIYLCLAGNQALATKISSVGSGNWNQDGTWDNTHPGATDCYDTICVAAGDTVTITFTENLESCDTLIIIVNGFLKFQTGKKLSLPCGSSIDIQTGGEFGVGGGGGSSTYIEFCGVDCWKADAGDITGPLVLISGACVLLPIELINFEANMNYEDRSVDVTWVTKSETNNDYYVIDRSADGLSWNFLGEVEGAGSSSIELDYLLPDPTPTIGINYYRLTQYDFDGAYKIFDPVAVVNEGVSFDSNLIIFQSGNEGLINLFLKNYSKETVVINIYNLSGQVVYSKEIFINDDGIAVISLNSDISFGSYIIRASEEIEKTVIK